MMGHKHLHELLEEDQEPFLLKNYIFDRRSQLNKPIPKTKLQAKKFRPTVEISNPKRSLWKQACFVSLHQSPEVGKSPWPATAKLKSHCNCKRQNSAVLLEAARKITQKQSKPKTQITNGGFGLIGSVMKRLRWKNRPRKREIGGKSGFEMGCGCDCNNSRRDSGAVRSEKIEGKSRDVETCRRWEEIIIGSGFEESENGGESPFRFSLRKSTCSSPRFSLRKSTCSSPRKTDFSSPATSPVRCDKQEKCGPEGTPKIQLDEEKEQKEQCSPVSVLDPPFEDDEEGREDGNDVDGYDLDCSYAIVQSAKQKLLEKLLRFEKLAELDPIELEKRMLEEQEDDEDDEEVDTSIDQFNNEKNVDRFVREVLIHQNKDSVDMRRLVIDLIAEENREEEEGGINDSKTVVKKVCERLDSWKEVESNTIDMMVELDFRRQIDGWKRIDREQVVEIAVEIEISIFGLLEEELYQNFA